MRRRPKSESIFAKVSRARGGWEEVAAGAVRTRCVWRALRNSYGARSRAPSSQHRAAPARPKARWLRAQAENPPASPTCVRQERRVSDASRCPTRPSPRCRCFTKTASLLQEYSVQSSLPRVEGDAQAHGPHAPGESTDASRSFGSVLRDDDEPAGRQANGVALVRLIKETRMYSEVCERQPRPAKNTLQGRGQQRRARV